MRTLKTVFGMVSDWSVVKWSVLIGREQLSRDQVERFDWLIKEVGGVVLTTPQKSVRGSVWA